MNNVVVRLAVLAVLAPLAVDIPLCCLAAILFVVAWNMSEARHFVRMVRRAPHADVVILLVTFVLTVFADLVVAVESPRVLNPPPLHQNQKAKPRLPNYHKV